MLGETLAGLLPLVEEMLASGIVAAGDTAFLFRHPLLGRAVGEMIPRPARSALHRQFGEVLLRRGESAAAATCHLLEAASTGDHVSLTGLDGAAAELLPSAPRTAARLAQRALELTQARRPGRAVPFGRGGRSAHRGRTARTRGPYRAAGPGPAGHGAGRGPLPLRAVRDPVGEWPARAGPGPRPRPSWPSRTARRRARCRDHGPVAGAGRGGRRGDAQRLAASVLRVPSQHRSQAVAAALVARALADWDSGQVCPGPGAAARGSRQRRAVPGRCPRRPAPAGPRGRPWPT